MGSLVQDVASLIQTYFCNSNSGKFQSGIVYCLSQKECTDPETCWRGA